MFKVSNKLTVPLMNEIFVTRDNAYNLRKPPEFVRPKVKCFSWSREHFIPWPSDMGYDSC